ncbi:hypothetical protein OG897_11170 [Streptomyces sp. NBC_00237]|uniref:hypothetical protein n=1 Tax=Streptomyces sp. NBC_00237 TaxID=2975687 RepID=UPI002252A014|nr:hypothetical protein [Streptomyces sp. NBC_00237]MCX5202009.1 hypothetical protein [Streptomyces sp. NBC_00237]
MTSTPLAPTGRAVPAHRPASTTRRVLRVLSAVACLPYLAIKITWIAGGRLGIPDGSALLDNRALMIIANSATVLMDAGVIVLAMLLTQAWGRRVPAALLALPMWAASGLLAPIMTGFPLQLVFGESGGVEAEGHPPFLDPWVFTVVYGGFLLQGIALGGLFVPYAKERWGHLWQGPVARAPRPGAALRTLGITGAVLALACAVPHFMTAFTGNGAGVVEPVTVNARLVSGSHGAFALAACAGLLMLALRIGGRTPLKAALAMAWTGSGALGCWGAWMLVTGNLLGNREPAPLPDLLTYAVQVIIGLLALVGGTLLFARLRRAE